MSDWFCEISKEGAERLTLAGGGGREIRFWWTMSTSKYQSEPFSPLFCPNCRHGAVWGWYVSSHPGRWRMSWHRSPTSSTFSCCGQASPSPSPSQASPSPSPTKLVHRCHQGLGYDYFKLNLKQKWNHSMSFIMDLVSFYGKSHLHTLKAEPEEVKNQEL